MTPTIASRARQLTARIAPSHLLAAGWLFLFLYAFPGYMSTDSIDQLQQARSGVRTDWHPPLMAWLWGVLDRVVSGPVLMLVLQLTLFFAGIYRLLGRLLPARPAALATCAIALFPTVATTMAVIWKDSQMAAFLVAGAAAALSSSRRWRIVGWVLLGAAAAMRHNAPAAILPLAVFVVWQTSARRRLARLALGVAASLGLLVGATAVNHALTVERQHPWYGSLALMDLAGTTRYAGYKTDAELQHLLRDTGLVSPHDLHAHIVRVYSPRTWWWLTHGADRIWEPPPGKRERLAIRRAWLDLVRTEPVAYWKHRRRVFNELLGLTRQPLWSPVYDKFAEAPEQAAGVSHNHAHSTFQRRVGGALHALSRTPLFRVYWYLAAAVVLLAVAAWRRHGLAVVVLTSGLGYQLTYFFLAPSPDFRYSHWMITCVVGTAVAAAAFALHARRAGRAP
ncbi:MAG: hypothetical protein HS111_14660 [Kofleriaceae bacterium]|nr:hypothetical protein [Kofleriaceae bacterium]MCL4225474.1 hypothetical protein [Myxococcales bacterium]